MAVLSLNKHKITLIHITERLRKSESTKMGRKLFCVSVVVCWISLAVGLPSKAWASSNGWTTEASHRSGWDKMEMQHSDAWKQATGDDSQGNGWVSSESGTDSKPKAIPTSWQQVDRHHGSAVKSSGWTNIGEKAAINPPSQEIANGFVVHHPIPITNPWNQSPLSSEPWNKQNTEAFWPEDANKKSPSTAGWEKAAAAEQWQQNQTPGASSSWDSKSAWEKTEDGSSASLWNKNSSPVTTWESSALNDRESAAGYAATGPAHYGQETSMNAWQEKPSNNGWNKNSSPTDGWKKDSIPSALYDAPVKSASGNSGWQKASTGWDSSSDFKTWQQETNGWTDSTTNEQNQPWQKDSSSNGWQKSSTGISNGWDKQGSH